MPDTTPLLARDPSHIGQYALAARLGAGGMGVVYLAWKDGQPVAVKVMREELSGDPSFRSRFGRELDVLRRIGGICTAAVLDADADAEPPYLVTEYVPGPSLNSYVDSHGPLPASELLALATGLAGALRSIHAAGIVHRDLKPSNVLLSPEGPRVIDFGIAQVADATSLTQTSTALGSPGYIAPEQIRRTSNTAAADVFTWAATVAFAATGHAPFGYGAADAVLFRVLHEDANLERWSNPALRPVVEAALNKDPERRPTPAQLMAALLPADLTRQLSEDDATVQLLERTWHLPVQSTAPLPRPPEPVPVKTGDSSRPWRRYVLAAVAGLAVGAASLIAVPPDTDESARARSATTDADIAARPASDVQAQPAQPSAAAAPAAPPTAAASPPLPERDWSSVQYDVRCDADGDGSEDGIESAEQHFGDVTGDSRLEALVTVQCREDVDGGNATPASYLLLFAGDSPAGAPRLIDTIGDGDAEAVGAAQLIRNGVVVTSPSWSEGAPRCCPDLTTFSTYKLRGNRLRLADEVIVSGPPAA